MMLDLKHLIRLKLRGMSNRSIADLLGLDRNTVNRYVQWLDSLKQDYSTLYELSPTDLSKLFERSSQLEQQRYEALAEQFTHWEQALKKVGATYKNVWEAYRKADPQGYGYTQFKKHLHYLTLPRKFSSFQEIE